MSQAQTQTQIKKSGLLYQTHLQETPKVIDGSGVRLTVIDPDTGERREILDANSGAAVSSIGHRDPEIHQKMKEAVDNAAIYNFPLTTTNQASEDLAEFLIENSPRGAFEAALFTGSGSESNENALRIVRLYHLQKGEPQRVKYVSRVQSYHGYTTGALSIGDNTRRAGFNEVLLPTTQTPKASQCYPYREMKAGETEEQYKDRLLEDLEDIFIKEGPETIAAFIAETVTGSTFGCQTPVPGYLDGARDICHKYGALFYLDEVMCGTGRMGVFHAWQKYMTGAGPDIQTNGKTLGAGYVTIASVLLSPGVMKVLRDTNASIVGGQTYHQHGFNCQVALEVQRKVKRDNLIANIEEQGSYFKQYASKKLANSKSLGELRGAGGFYALEWVKDKETKEPYPREINFGPRFVRKLYENGVFTLGGTGTVDGPLGDHALFAPAFTVTRDEIIEIVDAIALSLSQLETELGV